MWFLQTDLLIAMIVAAALAAMWAALCRRKGWQTPFGLGLLALDLGALVCASPGLALFYACYTLFTYGLGRALGQRRGKKLVFVTCCLLCCLPFFYGRIQPWLEILPAPILLVGMAYNMLKAVDSLYYIYYTGERIPLLTYANFILFFPVLTAGPIFRYRDFAPALAAPLVLTWQRLEYSAKRMIWGLFKKVVVLALCLKLMDHLVALEGGWYISLAIILLSYISLYLDMSGYADMAVSLSGAMGLPAPENFNQPWLAPTFTQFWRRWHITLSDWIREHIFVVLGRRRLSRGQGAIVAFLTMFFMCLWHGFTLAYVLDGLLLGAILAGENLLNITTVKRRQVRPAYYALRCLVANGIFAANSLLLTLGGATGLAVIASLLRW